MKKLPLRSRRLMKKYRRIIAHAGLWDSRSWPVPVFVDHLLNRAVWLRGNQILHARTFRKKSPPDKEES